MPPAPDAGKKVPARHRRLPLPVCRSMLRTSRNREARSRARPAHSARGLSPRRQLRRAAAAGHRGVHEASGMSTSSVIDLDVERAFGKVSRRLIASETAVPLVVSPLLVVRLSLKAGCDRRAVAAKLRAPGSSRRLSPSARAPTTSRARRPLRLRVVGDGESPMARLPGPSAPASGRCCRARP